MKYRPQDIQALGELIDEMPRLEDGVKQHMEQHGSSRLIASLKVSKEWQEQGKTFTRTQPAGSRNTEFNGGIMNFQQDHLKIESPRLGYTDGFFLDNGTLQNMIEHGAYNPRTVLNAIDPTTALDQLCYHIGLIN